MAYTNRNFKTKKALREAIARGDVITCYQPGPYGAMFPLDHDGFVDLEGPHYPEPHRWYAQGIVKDGKLVKIS